MDNLPSSRALEREPFVPAQFDRSSRDSIQREIFPSTAVLAVFGSSGYDLLRMIEIVLGDFAFSAEPHVLEAFGVTDTFLKDADNIGSAADMGVDERVDELG